MIVVDASAGVAALLNAGPAREALSTEQLHAPHLIDSEIANVLRRKVAGGEVSVSAGWAGLDTWRRLGVIRYPVFAILERVWKLRDNLSAYDASYVALAEHLDINLLTADARLARAPDVRCAVTVVPR
jgi:predicted nucleic acid-binding protein